MPAITRRGPGNTNAWRTAEEAVPQAQAELEQLDQS